MDPVAVNKVDAMANPIELRSDNAAGVAPQILAALATANVGGAMAYGGDTWTEELHEVVAEAFGSTDVGVFPVASGTAANALALSAMCPPWGAVLCHETAHILRSEAGATSMFGGGAQMQGVPGPDYRLSEKTVKAALNSVVWGDNHESQPAVVSFTCPSDYGTVYTPAEVAAITALARQRGIRAHLDGARLANAIASLHCSPTALTREAGIDVFSLGAIKGGAMSTDAVVSFDAEVNAQLHYRLKRAGHVSSKMRFQSVQLITYLRDGLWVKLARQANAATAELARGLHRARRRDAGRADGEHDLRQAPTARLDGAGRTQRALLRHLPRCRSVRHQLEDHTRGGGGDAPPPRHVAQRASNCTAQRSLTNGAISDTMIARCSG